ncbi:MAG: hypothetical protein GQ582_07185 [Methyloprofundus sp.]|nr:hypothetical protein [Methyloprofundus sp.]
MKKLLLSSLLLLLAACDTSLQSLDPQFTQISAGDSKEKVIELLGKPANSESSSMLGISKSTLQWSDLEKDYEINFITGKVMTKESKSR